MYLLYLDESGGVENQNDRHFVIAGVAVFERTLHYLIQGIDEIMDEASLSEAELHGSPILGARTMPWKNMERSERISLMKDILEIISKNKRGCVAFGVVVEKAHLAEDEHPMEFAFEQITSRFDQFITRQNRDVSNNNKQRGLIIMDKSSDENKLQSLVKKFRSRGMRWGNLKNISEVPMFVDSKASRLIQLADLVAFSLWRRYEIGDAIMFDMIARQFDEDGGKIHGLLHHAVSRKNCACPSCITRS